MIKSFHAGGGKGKPVHVQIAFSYARDEEIALQSAFDQWRSNLSERASLADFDKVEQFDKMSEHIKIEDVKSKILVSSDPEKHIAQIKKVIDLGVENVILHNVNVYQEEFIEDFGAYVLQIKGIFNNGICIK